MKTHRNIPQTLLSLLFVSAAFTTACGDDNEGESATGEAGETDTAESDAGSGNSNSNSGNSDSNGGNSDSDSANSDSDSDSDSDSGGGATLQETCANLVECGFFDQASCEMALADASDACLDCSANTCDLNSCSAACNGGDPNGSDECDPAQCQAACEAGGRCLPMFDAELPNQETANCVALCDDICGDGFFDDEDQAFMDCVIELDDRGCNGELVSGDVSACCNDDGSNLITDFCE